MNVDYIIVGQGISGTMLSYFLSQQNIDHVVIDELKENSPSKIASGVINPITGRRFVKTWMIDEVMPFAVEAYKSLEKFLHCNIITQKNVIDFHTSIQMQEAFNKRALEEKVYLQTDFQNHQIDQLFNYSNGIGLIQPVWLIDINIILKEWRKYLTEKKSLIEEHFDTDQLQLEDEYVVYKNIKAKKIFFADGLNSMKLNWFENLPFVPNKGEAIIVEIPKLLRDLIYKNGLTIVPWKDDLFWVGSSYEWTFENELPTNSFKEKVESVLSNWLKTDYKIIDHIAAVRPANIERRPFVGILNHQQQIGILNGMGTKGCSLAPYFANEMVQHLQYQKHINVEADVNRFYT